MNIKTGAKSKLKDFTQPEKADLPTGVSYRHSLAGDYDMWRLARFIFSDILSFKISDQPFEKINWVISFVYQSKYKCTISHEKFGFRVYVHNGADETEAKATAEAIEEVLIKAITMVVPLVEQYAKDALSKGEIIVENRFSELFRPYDYFRRTALIKKKSAQKQRSLLSSGKPRRVSLWRMYSSVGYYEQATYFFFFSMLEHLCVLFLAYRRIPERSDVAKFSNLKWSEKFKNVFDINQPEFKSVYDHFIGLAKYKRNPAAHGYTHTVFSFYLEGAQHKISCTINDKDVALQWQNQDDNFTMMESFLKLLRTHPTTKNIFMYLDAGMNVSFSKKGLGENDMVANMSDEEIIEYVQFMTRRYDDAANMDW